MSTIAPAATSAPPPIQMPSSWPLSPPVRGRPSASTIDVLAAPPAELGETAAMLYTPDAFCGSVMATGRRAPAASEVRVVEPVEIAKRTTANVAPSPFSPVTVIVIGSLAPNVPLVQENRLRDSAVGFAVGRLSASFGALAAILLWMLIYNDSSFAAPIYTFYGAYFILIIGAFFSLRKLIGIDQFSWRLLRRAFNYGFPMSGVTAVSLCLPYGAQIVILSFLSSADVGAFSLGFRLSDATLANATMLILTVMTPLVMREYDRASPSSGGRSTELLKRTISLNALVTVPICLAIIVVAKPMLLLLFPDYSGAETVIVWIVLASGLRSLSMITVKGLELAGSTRLLFLLTLVAAVVNVIYMVFMIPLYGLAAAGHASFISYALLNALVVYAARRRAPIRFDYVYLLRVLCASVLAAVAAITWAHFFPLATLLALVVDLGVFFGVYLGACVLLRLHRGLRGVS